MSKDDWSKEICEMHKIDAKLYVANVLHNSFVDSGKDVDKLEFKEYANKQSLRSHISCQIMSLAFELTEDLAAICFSYEKAVRLKTKNVPEYLRDFGDVQKKQKGDDVGNPSSFYEKVTKNIIEVARMTGLDPVKDANQTLAYREVFKGIKEFRDVFDDYYQGFKHGQRTMAMYLWPSNVVASKENMKFVFYRIPQELEELNGQVFPEMDAADAFENEVKFMNLIGTIAKMYSEVRGRQFPKVFP
jgi:hypothetical protein